MQISLTFHLIGLVMWLGGLIILSGLFRRVAVSGHSGEGADGVVTGLVSAWFMFVHGGMGLMILSGFHQLGSQGFGYYLSQGWFHGKLLVIVLLMVVSIVVTKEVKRLKNGEAANAARFSLAQLIGGISLVSGVGLTLIFR